MSEHGGEHWCLWCAFKNAVDNPGGKAHRTCENNQCCGRATGPDWQPGDLLVQCPETCQCDHSAETNARHVAELMAKPLPLDTE